SEASYHAAYDHCTVKYLQQAGVHPEWVKLADAGIHGNGHMMMLEKNNMDIAAAMSRWLAKALRPIDYRRLLAGRRRTMLSRREMLVTPVAMMIAAEAAAAEKMTLAIHQNTSAAAGYRASLE